MQPHQLTLFMQNDCELSHNSRWKRKQQCLELENVSCSLFVFSGLDVGLLLLAGSVQQLLSTFSAHKNRQVIKLMLC